MRILYLLFLVFAMNCNMALAKSHSVIKEIDTYLHSFNTLSATFIQSGGDDVRRGNLYVKKPNSVRVEYHAPYKELIVSNDKLAMHYDAELKEKNYIALDDVYFVKLFSKKFSLAKDANIISLAEANGKIIIKFSLKSDPDIGTIIFVFQKDPLKLESLAFGDHESFVEMKFTKLELSSQISDDFFDLENISIN